MDMIEPFDFSMIEDEPVEMVKETSYEMPQETYEDDDEELSWDVEDDVEEEGDVEDESKSLASSVSELAENFSDLPDDLEFKVGDVAVTKKELAEVVAQREFISKSNKEFEDFTKNITEQNMQIESHLNMAMTEARIKYEHYTKLLQDADNLHASDVQKALRLQKEAAKRYNELEQHSKEYRRVEEQRQQEVDVMRIRRTDNELRGKLTGYRGINETLAPLMTWAQEQGIPQEGLMKAMSPALIQTLMDAKEYRDRVGGKKAAISAAASRGKPAPKSISSKSSNKTPVRQKSSNNKASFEAAMRNNDMATAFKFLED